jgi:hypothetical protein
MAREKKCKRRG